MPGNQLIRQRGDSASPAGLKIPTCAKRPYQLHHPTFTTFSNNTSTVAVVEKGASQKLAHLTRTHRVNLHWLGEVIASQGVHVSHILTNDQAADIFTKAFTDPAKWRELRHLVGVHENLIVSSNPGSSASILPCCVLSPKLVGDKMPKQPVDKQHRAYDSTWVAGSEGSDADKWQRDRASGPVKKREAWDSVADMELEFECCEVPPISGVVDPVKSKFCYFVLETLNNTAALQGSLELRRAVKSLPFELQSACRSLASMCCLTQRATRLVDLLSDTFKNAPGKPEPLTQLKDVPTRRVRYDIVGDSSLILHPDFSTPGVTRNAKGGLAPPPGWKPSVTGIYNKTKMFTTHTGACDLLAEGGATVVSIGRLVDELWARSPVETGPGEKTLRFCIVVWNANDVSTWNQAKGGNLRKHVPINDDMRKNALALREKLKRYDGARLFQGLGHGGSLGPSSGGTAGPRETEKVSRVAQHRLLGFRGEMP